MAPEAALRFIKRPDWELKCHSMIRCTQAASLFGVFVAAPLVSLIMRITPLLPSRVFSSDGMHQVSMGMAVSFHYMTSAIGCALTRPRQVQLVVELTLWAFYTIS
ncbi:unnamed protein product [Protopolystoma xenopodis]|uniref:Uncharacterized protein n=1 Tax=Protopolystoma xenopodis TaxID=117903 RepID=A0A448WTV0_9PLAT|nr:unnamed protein product [Protopolystoma xenopodis]